MLGYNGIPERWKSGVPEIAESKFAYTDYSFNEHRRIDDRAGENRR